MRVRRQGVKMAIRFIFFNYFKFSEQLSYCFYCGSNGFFLLFLISLLGCSNWSVKLFGGDYK